MSLRARASSWIVAGLLLASCSVDPFALDGQGDLRADAGSRRDGGFGNADAAAMMQDAQVDASERGTDAAAAADASSDASAADAAGADGCAGQAEACNEADDDCDGKIDEGFDFDHDVQHCGGCSPCAIPHAASRCNSGKCEILACDLGFADGNDEQKDGCELRCIPSGPEICDGRDNDCDGLKDDADPDLIAPPNFCSELGACDDAMPKCSGKAGWRCDFEADVELSSPGHVIADEKLCDGIDGDCDGVVDDSFPLLGMPCGGSPTDRCASSGTYACSADHLGVVCNITSPAQGAIDELCNGIDDDCDGDVDEEADGPEGLGVRDDMQSVTVGASTVYVYRYEASRPDATLGSTGISPARACSKPGVQPWSSVTHAEAANACAQAGKRLCTEAEFAAACSGVAVRAYPYGNVYSENACNGLDYDTDPAAAGNQDAALATGALAVCKTPEGIADLSGNLKEWMSNLRGTIGTPARDVYAVRGGSFDNLPDGLRCDFAFSSAPEDYAAGNLGFRCCSDQPP